MYISVPSSVTSTLIRKPETGMGYQILDIGQKRNDVSFVLVENAEVVTAAWSVEQESPIIRLSARKASVYPSEEQRIQKALATGDFRVIDRPAAVHLSLATKSRSAGSSLGPASDALSEMSSRLEKFLRFSAYKNDRRILLDGSVLPETYVTTHEDGETVRTGMEAVRRYALPSPMPAVHKFYLRPPDPIRVRRGVVAPANNQPGGGIEAIFIEGSSAGTRFDYKELPSGE